MIAAYDPNRAICGVIFRRMLANVHPDAGTQQRVVLTPANYFRYIFLRPKSMAKGSIIFELDGCHTRLYDRAEVTGVQSSDTAVDETTAQVFFLSSNPHYSLPVVLPAEDATVARC